MRLFNYLKSVHANRNGHTTLPRFLTYTVTFSCNARCIMCDSWKKPSPNDLSTQEVGRIFDQLPQMDAIRLTGGEPFVRKDMLEIATMAQEKLKPIFLHITTNGFLPDRIISFCEQRPKTVPLQLLISMDGTQDKHNHVRGHKKAWDYVTRTLKELAPRQKELRLRLSVNQTIVDADGAEQYRELHEFLRPYGVRNNMVMAYDSSATYNVNDEVDLAPAHKGEFHTFGDFSTDRLVKLLDEVESDLHEFPLIDRLAKRYYMKGIRNRLLEGHGSPNPKCVSLNSHLRIFPSGQIPVCQFNTKVVGNLREQSFDALWHSDEAEKQRDWVRQCPGCWAECEILPNAIYSGDLLFQKLPKGGTEQAAEFKPGTVV